MYFIIEGDIVAVEKVEKKIKELVDMKDFRIDASFENRKEDYSKLLQETQEKGDGIIVNHCLTKFIRTPNGLSKSEMEYEYRLAETCLRLSKANAIFIVATENEISPFILTYDSTLHADYYLVIEPDKYPDDLLTKDVEAIVDRFNVMKRMKETLQ